MPLPSGTANIVHVPSDRAPMKRHVEDMLGDSHGLYARMQDVVCTKLIKTRADNRGLHVPVVGMYPDDDTRTMLSKKLGRREQNCNQMRNGTHNSAHSSNLSFRFSRNRLTTACPHSSWMSSRQA